MTKPNRKASRRSKPLHIRKLLRLAFLFIVLYATYQLFWNVKGRVDYQKGQETIQSLKAGLMSELAPPEQAAGEVSDRLAEDKAQANSSKDIQASQAGMQADRALSQEAQIALFNRLKAEVPALVAWLYIPGANIDMPIVQGQDNAYYLNHDYRGKYNRYGAPFLDQANASDFSDQNSIIYAHNAPGEKVFGELTAYEDPSYLDKAPVMELLTSQGKSYYDIQCVYIVDPYDNFRSVQYEGQDWQTFIKRWQDKNILDFPAPQADDHLLTLQTCLITDERLVIHGVKQAR